MNSALPRPQPSRKPGDLEDGVREAGQRAEHDDEKQAEQQRPPRPDPRRDPARDEHRETRHREVAGEQQRDLARRGGQVLREHGQDRIDQADAHEGDDAREGDGVDGTGLVQQRRHEARSWSRAGRAAASAASASSSRRSSRVCSTAARPARTVGELLTAGVGDLDVHGAGVHDVARLAHEPVLLEPVHQDRHRRLGDQLGRGEVGHPQRPFGAQPAQRQQRADAAAARGVCTQELRDERDTALELSGEIFDSQTI